MRNPPHRNLRTGGSAELTQNIADVFVGRQLGDHQRIGDLLVGQPTRDQGSDLAFPLG